MLSKKLGKNFVVLCTMYIDGKYMRHYVPVGYTERTNKFLSQGQTEMEKHTRICCNSEPLANMIRGLSASDIKGALSQLSVENHPHLQNFEQIHILQAMQMDASIPQSGHETI